jgi:uncharacterized cupredoxin-like copper-binding protein
VAQNLGWAFGYNLAAIPLAALGLLNPVVAGAAMGLSSVSVVLNSLRLLRFGRPSDRGRPTLGGWRRRRVALAWLVPAAILAVVAAVGRTEVGSPAAGTVIALRMTDNAFSPAHLDVPAGTVVRLDFTNAGRVEHEAVVGDAAVQAGHDRTMAPASHHSGHRAAVEVAPGRTASLTYRFAAPGRVLIGCHQPGHYQAGMVATVDVTPAS